MNTLSPSDRHFLDAVNQVMELELVDAELAARGRTLWPLLARAEARGWALVFDRIILRLRHIGELRADVARTLDAVRSREGLQVPGR
jgi:hypothetical protein